MKFQSLQAASRTAFRPFARASGLLGAAAALLLGVATSCGTAPGATGSSFEGPSRKGGDDSVGAVAFDLQVGSAVIQTVHYEVKGGTVDKTGTIDVSSAPRVSAIVGGIPFGTGYRADLTADSSSGPTLHCAGSATFDLTMPGTTPVGVHLACQETPNVPVPPGARVALFAMLLGAGLVTVGRRRAPRRG